MSAPFGAGGSALSGAVTIVLLLLALEGARTRSAFISLNNLVVSAMAF